MSVLSSQQVGHCVSVALCSVAAAAVSDVVVVIFVISIATLMTPYSSALLYHCCYYSLRVLREGHLLLALLWAGDLLVSLREVALLLLLLQCQPLRGQPRCPDIELTTATTTNY